MRGGQVAAADARSVRQTPEDWRTLRMRWTRKARYFFPLALGILLTDCATKRVAEATLAPAHVPHPILGDFLRFTLSYNPGAAMSLSLGSYSRVAFSILAGA